MYKIYIWCIERLQRLCSIVHDTKQLNVSNNQSNIIYKYKQVIQMKTKEIHTMIILTTPISVACDLSSICP